MNRRGLTCAVVDPIAFRMDPAPRPASSTAPILDVGGLSSPILTVEGLCVEFTSAERRVVAVRDMGFAIARGKTVAVVGESGSGKSVTALSIMRLVEQGGGRITAGRMLFAKSDGSIIDL